MIFTPEERRALFAVVTLLLIGQILVYWDRYRRTKPDRDLSRWLTHLAAVRAEESADVDSLTTTREFLRFIEDDPSSAPANPTRSQSDDRSPDPAVEPRSAAPPGILETGRLRINEAEAEHLEALPGIGPALAQRILLTRAEGSFRCAADLLEVSGIGPKKLRQLEDLLDFSDPPDRITSPIKPDG